MGLVEFVTWLGETPGSVALHESQYMYAFIETAHVMGIMMFVGTIAMVDLRLLGLAFNDVSVSAMLKKILPWTVGGFLVMVATGLLLFYAIPVRTYHSLWFRLKAVLLIAGAVNIWHFHRRVQRDVSKWDVGVRPPVSARVSAVVSLMVWAGVIVAGRFIAYNWFDCDRPQPGIVRMLASCPAIGV